MKNIKLIILIGLLSNSYLLFAQQIQTDRPTETESPSAISDGHLQIENGFSFEQLDDEKTFEVPQVVLRYGLFKNAEFRVETAYEVNHNIQEKLRGIKPVVLGVKYHFFDHKGAIPDIGILGRLSLPWLADNSLKEKKYSPEIRLLVQHELSKKTHVGYNIGVQWLDENSSHSQYIYSLSADHAMTKKIKLVAEAYGFAEHGHHAQNTADLAVLYLINNNFQLDLIGGSGIMHSPQQKFVELGLSFRI